MNTKVTMTLAALALLLILVACTVLSPGQAAEVRAAMQPLVDNGSLTSAQVEAIIASLSGGSVDWEGILTHAGTAAVAIIGAILGVDLRRGTIHNRKGDPPPVPAS